MSSKLTTLDTDVINQLDKWIREDFANRHDDFESLLTYVVLDNDQYLPLAEHGIDYYDFTFVDKTMIDNNYAHIWRLRCVHRDGQVRVFDVYYAEHFLYMEDIDTSHKTGLYYKTYTKAPYRVYKKKKEIDVWEG